MKSPTPGLSRLFGKGCNRATALQATALVALLLVALALRVCSGPLSQPPAAPATPQAAATQAATSQTAERLAVAPTIQRVQYNAPSRLESEYSTPPAGAAGFAAHEPSRDRCGCGPAGLASSASPCAAGFCVGAEQSRCVKGVEGHDAQCGLEARWYNRRPIPWEAFGPGEYVGPARTAHLSAYRFRPQDQLRLIYLLTREQMPEYELNFGDQIRIESASDPDIRRELTIRPDGMINLPLIGSVRAARATISELTREIERLYFEGQFIRDPKITITALETNTRLKDIFSTVDSRQGFGGTSRLVNVSPDGTITLAGLHHPICCQGLTVCELQDEINARYKEIVLGLQITVTLEAKAPSFIFVLGEVNTPNRYELQGPTRLLGALAMAGNIPLSGNQRQIIVLRRTEDWGVAVTMLDLRGALYAKRPCPTDDIWMRDGDIVIVPKHAIQQANDVINLIFTQGLYQLVPRWNNSQSGSSLL